MKTTPQKSLSAAATAFIVDAFTLIELLVVIAIIAILAAMLLPVLSVAAKSAKKTEAKTEIANIDNAITAYESDYSRFPVPSDAQAAGFQSFTCGGTFKTPIGPYAVGSTNSGVSPTIYHTNNSVVMAILMDFTNYPNGYNGSGGVGSFTDNTNYQKNPKQVNYLSKVKANGWTPPVGQAVQPPPGLGNDLNYRDPWGNPYVITMDLNEDNQTYDAFYQSPAISSSTTLNGGSGYNGLSFNAAANNNVGGYGFHGNVMVWSAGPDGQLDITNAIQGLNKDNILSWQQ